MSLLAIERRTVNVDQRISQELTALGFEPTVLETGETVAGRQSVVAFLYPVPVGRFRGNRFMVGVSTRCEAVGYPEVPPHWIFISPPITDTHDGANHGLLQFGDREWVALSRPPGAFWDRVDQKGMGAYLDHLKRVWRGI